MKKSNNPLMLILSVIVIVAVIWAIQSSKPAPVNRPAVPNTIAQSIAENTLITAENEPSITTNRAPEFQGISGRINADENVTLKSLRGKVVLVDFWTYSCINCIRTLPFLKRLDERYRGQGLAIIGIHTPEFGFEYVYANVQRAVEKYGIKYPVLQDNDYATWRAYENQYWPHKYLVDAKGSIRFDHIGEGGEEELEQKIVELLKEIRPEVVMADASKDMNRPEFGKIGTPELYFGYRFIRAPLGNPEGYASDQVISYARPIRLQPNRAYLEGEWRMNSDHMELVGEEGGVFLDFQAKQAHIVASGGGKDANIMTQGFSSTIPLNELGDEFDSRTRTLTVNDERLYTLIDGADYARKRIEIKVKGKGFKLYSFTFG